MILGGDPANLTGQGLADNVQRFVQSLPANDPNTAWLRGQVADLQAHVADIEYARTHCSTNDWIDRTAQFASGAIVFSIGVLTAETGAGVVAAAAGGVGAATAGVSLLQCLVGSK
ncbi:galactose-1-phosphate uridylyltransferase [Mycobacterium tuberculosis]|nr:galactose-1-phosphate uridylyltransferase [Mycobacterium tuberculosis]CLO09257.1 galactose-1-phosphate uridylyltransferase [Mycobacterium tuberculosis]CNV42748.1 galactose-1-phosphate uridylyltransferase [Mycobacterium tuberculosis]